MSTPTPPSSDSRFITRLESLRGCAAIIVAVVHSYAIFAYAPEAFPTQTTLQTLVHVIFPGTTALITFFVISGYVLSLSLDRSETTIRNVMIFYMRRLFRIFPAHIVWIFIALGLLFTFGGPEDIPTADAWFNEMNSAPITVTLILANLALFVTSLIPGEWTLTLELIVYMIYPIMYLINRRGGVVVNVLFMLVLLACSFFLSDSKLFHYLYAFYFGLAAQPLYKRYIERISERKAVFLFRLCLALLVLFPILGGLFKFLTLMVQVVAGSYVIFACMYMKRDSAIFRFLDGDRIQRMGQISYSFYVCHFLINYWVAQGLFHLVGYEAAAESRFMFMTAVAVISITIAHRCASISYEWIEAPTMKYSADLSRRLRQVPAASDTAIAAPAAEPVAAVLPVMQVAAAKAAIPASTVKPVKPDQNKT